VDDFNLSTILSTSVDANHIRAFFMSNVLFIPAAYEWENFDPEIGEDNTTRIK
jgi:hypothetical protein